MKYIDWLIQWLENISARQSKYGLTSDTGSSLNSISRIRSAA